MKDRFEQLYQIPKNLYVKDAPIVILAGSLLKDKVSGNVVAQIKYQSLSEKAIKALKINIMSMDVSGQDLGDIIEYQYLDLDVRVGQDFGSNKAIVFPNTVARSFRVVDITVIFDDGEKWFNDVQMESLAIAQSLESALGDSKMKEQYQRATNSHAVCKPIQEKDLWCCSCGTWNRSDNCVRCSLRKDVAFNAFNVETLRERLKTRLAEEEEQARIVEVEESKRKRKQKWTLLIVTLLAIAVGIVLILELTKVDRIMNQARDAIAESKYAYAMEKLDKIKEETDVQNLQEELRRLMNDEISKAIEEQKCEEAVHLLEEYSPYLRSGIVSKRREQIMNICPHQSMYSIEGSEPTCETYGHDYKICDLCGYKKEIQIKALGHDWRETSTEKVCERCSKKIEK